MKKRYLVNADAWLYGKFYHAGESIELTEKQAKYEVMSGTIVKLAEPTKPAKAAPKPKSKEDKPGAI